MQRAIGLAAAARGADGVVDEGVGHRNFSNLSAAVLAKAGTHNPSAIDRTVVMGPGPRARSAIKDARERANGARPGRQQANYKLLAIINFMISFVPA